MSVYHTPPTRANFDKVLEAYVYLFSSMKMKCLLIYMYIYNYILKRAASVREGASFVLCFSAQNTFNILPGPTQGSLQIKSTKIFE